MPSDIMDRVVGVVEDATGTDGWCSRAQNEDPQIAVRCRVYM